MRPWIERSLPTTTPTSYCTTLISYKIHKVGQEAAVDNFAARLLETLGYASGRQVIATRQVLPLIICGMQYSAPTEVCIWDENDYLLLVPVDKRLEDPEPQPIAAYR